MMITNRELLEQIEQLNEKNSTLTDELQQIKEMMQQQNKNKNDQSSNDQRKSSNGEGISNIANDFMKIKGLISQLENQMKGYISKNSKDSQALSEDDVVNLILSMMDGMVNWTLDFVSKQNDQSNQLH